MTRRLFAVVIGLLGGSSAVADPPAPRFERDVQPILLRCVACHGAGKARGDLRLDSRDAAVRHGALVPGNPEKSELLRRVSAADATQRMPPKGNPLTAAEVDTLRRWIAAGADWPAHWAYRPLSKPPMPSLTPRADALGSPFRNPIDQFILEKLAEHGLTPAPEADKRTLLRRLSFDLIGLPPTPEEVAAFLADSSPDAYEKVVERLLASPHYGERWARHWMDIVHYAETHGHDQDRPRDHAWPYRDYLIRCFNEDKPYARFVEEQVAGDVLFPGDPWAIVATGFLATGPWDESSLRDIREDAIDREIGRYLDRDDIVTTVMSTFASTTVHCARCHDHKFDPVSQEDYYALQAVFAATDKGNRPYDADPQIGARRRQLNTARAELAKRPPKLDAKLTAEVAAWERDVARAGQLWQILEPTSFRSAEGTTLAKQPDGSLLAGGSRPAKDTYTITGRPGLTTVTGLRLEVLTDDSLPHKGPGRQDNGNLHLNEITVTAAGKPIVIRSAKADFDQEGWTIAHAIDANPATAWGIYPMVGKPHRAVFTFREPIPLENGAELTVTLQQTHGGGHLIGRPRLSVIAAPQPADADALPATVAAILRIPLEQRTEQQRTDLATFVLDRRLERELKALPPPSLVYCGSSQFLPDNSFVPAKSPRPIHVLKRGDVRTPGPLANPGTVACVPGLESRFRLPNPDNEGRRRAALAAWLSDSKNGLTWRSIANRVWQYHFGRGLVDSPNDFGKMGATPTHPELLDWLAVTLQGKPGANRGEPGASAPGGGGSLKALHRLIVTSATYRQSSRHDAACAAVDSDNRYLWRQNRRRLDAEALHDAVLVLSGRLDRTMGGPSARQFILSPGVHVTPNVDYLGFDPDAPATFRRSVYRFVFRTLPDPLMESLACPDGSQLTPVRGASVTAVQALAMLNDKFMVRQCEHVAERLGRECPGGLADRVTGLFRWALGRDPTSRESEVVAAYAAKHGLANACRVLLNSNEFVFVD